jgi:ABC-type iron transport system FetAB ATPase subunit
MLANSKNVNISGGEFHITYSTKTSETAQKSKHIFDRFGNICSRSQAYIGIELLQKKTVPGALHNSDERYDPPKCHAHTREAILQEIMDWIEDLDRQTRFLWLHGPAGCGKSAIGSVQTIAELCSKMNFLAGSFFFSRSIGGRNEKTFLITTIVDQLIMSIPEIREHVGNALYNNSSLPTRSLEAQMDALIVKTLEAAASSSTCGVDFMNSRPKVIVLDGLDECSDPESQRYILKVLLNSVSNHSIPFPFILASRPSSTFAKLSMESS